MNSILLRNLRTLISAIVLGFCFGLPSLYITITYFCTIIVLMILAAGSMLFLKRNNWKSYFLGVVLNLGGSIIGVGIAFLFKYFFIVGGLK